MNNKKIIMILSIILIICCIIVGCIIAYDDGVGNNAKESHLIITCDEKNISKNESVVCNLKGKINEYDVSAFSSTLLDGTNYKIEEITPDTSWEGDGEKGDIDLYTDENKSGEFNILSFKVSLINDNEKEIHINLSKNSFFDENFEEHPLNDTSVTLVVNK